jgi:hypothetical protein
MIIYLSYEPLLKEEGSQGNVALCFVDLKKAYDTVSREALWDTLENLGFAGKFMNILKALYARDNIQVVVNGIRSEPIYPSRGLKQGCPLSPVLFSIYIMKLSKDLNKTKEGIWIGGIIVSALFFSDDLVLVGKNRIAVNRLLVQLVEGLENLGMEINILKKRFLK